VKKIVAALLVSVAAFAEVRLGKALSAQQPLSVAKLMESPDAWAGKTVQVKGKVSEVCAKMGCWMQLVEGGKAVRIKVNDGDIVFPKSAVGKTAVAEGTLRKLELTKEQAVARARHEAEERGTPFDPDSVTSGATIYQIQGTGAVILD
jgi:NACalpha-BTF3-like transcription factor